MFGVLYSRLIPRKIISAVGGSAVPVCLHKKPRNLSCQMEPFVRTHPSSIHGVVFLFMVVVYPKQILIVLGVDTNQISWKIEPPKHAIKILRVVQKREGLAPPAPPPPLEKQ